MDAHTMRQTAKGLVARQVEVCERARALPLATEKPLWCEYHDGQMRYDEDEDANVCPACEVSALEGMRDALGGIGGVEWHAWADKQAASCESPEKPQPSNP